VRGPKGGDYAHNTRNHDDNAPAHLRASLLGPSLSIPLVRGASCSGTWQQVVLIDFDDRPRERSVHVQISGLRLLHCAGLLRKWRPLRGLVRPWGGALYSAARAGSLRAARQARREGIPFFRQARRSLKTQQHAHLTAGFGRSSVCVQVRSAAGLVPEAA
jgi:hypothetical protein